MKKFISILLLTLTPIFAVQKELNDLFTELMSKDTFAGKKVVAVMPLKTGEGMEPDAGRSVSEFSVVSFHNSGRYTVVERANFAKVMEELELSQSDLVDEATQTKLGKMLVADRMLVGSVTESFGKRMVNVRLVKVETGEVVSSASATLGPAAMDDFMKELLGERGQMSASLYRSMVGPGWGQFYTGHPIRGAVSLAVFVGTLGYTLYLAQKTSEYRVDKNNFNLSNEETRLKVQDDCNNQGSNQANQLCIEQAESTALNTQSTINSDYSDSYDKTLMWGIITGGVWALNLADAAWAGAESKQKFNLYFSAIPQGPVTLNLVYGF